MPRRYAVREARLRDEASAYELSRLAYYREAGKTPGNPKWYTPFTVPQFKFKPNQPAVTPAWTRSTAMAPQEFKFPHWDETMDRDEYVKDFEAMNGLIHHPTQWITPIDGNYG